MRAFGLLLLAASTALAAEAPLAITGARVVTVSGPVLESATVVIENGKIAAVGPSVTIPAGAQTIDARGQTLYPGLIDGFTTMGLVEISSVAGSVDTEEIRDVNAEARAWVAVNPHSEAIPVARANGVTAALTAPQSGQSALIRLTGTSPTEMVLKAPTALHFVYPTGQPRFDISQMFEERERKTFEERQKERKKNQEKELRRLAHELDQAKAHAAALEAGSKSAADAPKPDLPREALALFARGEAPLVVQADREDDIRGAAAFAKERGAEARHRGRPRSLALRRRPEGAGRGRPLHRPPPPRPTLRRLRCRLHRAPEAQGSGRALRHRDRLHQQLPEPAL